MTSEEEAVARLPGGALDYVLRRSDRSRRLRVTIDPRRGVIVTIPAVGRRGWSRPLATIEAFLAEREPWIRRHLGQVERQWAAAIGAEVADGGVLRFRGEEHRLRIVPAGARVRRSSVVREGAETGDELIVSVAVGDRRDVATVLRGWLMDRARLAVEHEVARHASALGVTPSAVALRDPRSRWGSASREGRLMFSWRLVLAPPEALETVVVHELAHLRVFGHGPLFWAVVASRRPDHAAWRRWLREHSAELHAALSGA